MDHDELVNKRVHVIARAHSCSIDDVHAALDRHPIELDCDAYLKRTLALELMRLDQLDMAFGATGACAELHAKAISHRRRPFHGLASMMRFFLPLMLSTSARIFSVVSNAWRFLGNRTANL